MGGQANGRGRRSRRAKILAAVLLLGVATAVSAPWWLAPLVEGRLVAALEESTGGAATVEELSVSLGGRARLAGLRVEDADGAPLASLQRADLSVRLLSLLRGRIDAEVEVDGFEVHVRREDDAWSVAGVTGEADTGPEDEGDAAPPRVRAKVALRGGRVVVHGPGGTTELVDLAFTADVTSLEEPAPLELSLGLRGPSGPGGTVRASGSLTAASGGRLGARGLAGELRLELDAVELAALVPAVALVAPVRDLAGTLAGGADLRIAPGLGFDGRLEVTAPGVRFEPAREGSAPVQLGALRLSGEGGEEDGRFRHTLALEVEEARLDYSGWTSPGKDAALVGEGQLVLAAPAASLANLAAPWVSWREGLTLGGDLESTASVGFRVEDAGPRLEAQAVLTQRGLSAADAGGPVPLGDLPERVLEVDVAWDDDVLDVRGLDVDAGPVHATARGAVVLAGAVPSLRESSFELDADLDGLASVLARLADLDEGALTGSLALRGEAAEEGEEVRVAATVHAKELRLPGELDVGDADLELVARHDAQAGRIEVESVVLRSKFGDLRGDATLVQTDERLDATLRLSGDELRLPRAEGPDIVQRDVRLSLAAELDRASGAVTVREGKLSSASLAAGFDAVYHDLASSETRGRVRLEADLATLLRDLGPEADPGHEIAGALSASLELTGGTARAVRGEALVRALAVTSGELAFTEPEVTLGLNGALAPDGTRFDVTALSVASGFLRGGLTGVVLGLDDAPRLAPLSGELVYVPDRLGALLAPWLPGKLSGEEERSVRIEYTGPLGELDPWSLLAGGRGRATIGLGRYSAFGLDTTGELTLDLGDGRTRCAGELAANGGTLTVDGALALDGALDEPGARFSLRADGVQANSRLSPLLGRLHPAFAGIASLSNGQLGGLVTASLDLTYDAPVADALKAGGWSALDLSRFSGSGSLELRGLNLAGAPLVDEMLAALGSEGGRSLDVRPIEFRVSGGRLDYARPWKWRVGGTETSFTGAIGLDRTLDLTWSVPIGPELVRRHDVLRSLEGQTLAFPITGTLDRPRLDWQGAIGAAAKDALKGELGRRIGIGGDENPADLLRRADALWAEGKQDEARDVYRKLRADYRLSPAYLLNKDRIKERAN